MGSVVISAGAAGANLLYSVTAVASVAALMTGLSKSQVRRDVFQMCVQGMAVVATIAAVTIGPLSDIGPIIAGIALLVVSAAYWLAWGCRRSIWCVRAASALLPLGGLLVIFGVFSVLYFLFAGSTLSGEKAR